MQVQTLRQLIFLLLLSFMSLGIFAQVQITSEGNVGIGTDAPNEVLEIKGNLLVRDPGKPGALILSPYNQGYGLRPELVLQSTNTGSGSQSGFHISRNAIFQQSDGTFQYISSEPQPFEATKLEFGIQGDLKFSSAPADTGAITWTDNMIIKSDDGSVGIGTTSPSSRLDVAGGNISLNGGWLSNDGDSEGITVTSTGNVGINISNPTTPLGIVGNGATDYVGITQNKILAGATMELTTPDAMGNQATRIGLTGGTNDSDIIFFSGASGSEGSRMIIDGSNGYVGIGTNTPDSRLDLGGGNISLNGGFLSNDGENEGVFVAADGNVGIGVTTPQAKLEINAQGDGATVLRLGTERAWEFQQEGVGSAAALRLRNIVGGYGKSFIIDGGKTLFRTTDGTTSTTKVIIDHTAGRVGIGTTAPTNALDVNGEVRIQGGNPQAGARLVSTDSNGNAQWQLPSDDYFFERDEAVYSFSSSDANNVLFEWTIDLNEGDNIEIIAQATGRIPSGSGVDVFNFQVEVQACGFFDEDVLIQPGENSSDHDNRVNLQLFTGYQAPSDCTATILLLVNNDGDDAYTITNPRMSVRKIR